MPLSSLTDRFCKTVVLINRHHNDVLVVLPRNNDCFTVIVNAIKVGFEVSPEIAEIIDLPLEEIQGL